MSEELVNGSAEVTASTRRTLVAVMVILALLIAGSWVVGEPETPDGAGPPSARAASPGPSAESGAAVHVPSFQGAGFAVRDVDLAAWADPLSRAEDMVRRAMDDPIAPRNFGVGQDPGRTATGHRMTYLATTAVTCLHQRGSRGLHAYEDTAHPYSLAVVLVVDAATYDHVDVTGCALGDASAATPNSGADRSVPRLQPCAGLRREGFTVTSWVGTTSSMCAALNRGPGAVAIPGRSRDLRQGDVGTDVAGLQFLLKKAGFVMTVDGVFGGDVSNAIRVFERCRLRLSRSPEGVVTTRTMDAVRAASTSGWTLERCSG